jgi:hypothetical protein
MKRLSIVCALAVFLGSPAWAAEKPEDAAQAAAESWLKLVDDGKYEESWDQAAKLFKGAVTKEQWKMAVAGVRGPLGKLVSRKLKSREYMEKGARRPGREVRRHTVRHRLRKKASAVETVTPMVDPDGAWRVSGYFIR